MTVPGVHEENGPARPQGDEMMWMAVYYKPPADAEAFGEDKAGWKADLSSEPAKAATADAQEFATQGFDVVVYEELA